MLNALQAEIVGAPSTNPVDDIIEYLQEFRILLILDNLETVKDARIDDFLDRLPAGSKVLITSRIGLGEFERRLRLDSLEEHDSVRLVQALARIRGLDVLVNANRETLARYCRRMKNNPGFLKWFISAVQTGKRPEQILDQPGLFLDYCMSNVYEYLAVDSRALVEILQVITQQLGQAELAFLGGYEVIPLQRALYQATATNMVRMGTVGAGSAAETKYSLSELARDYLAKHHPVESSKANRLRWRFKEIQEAGNLIDQESRVNRFSFYSIVRRSRGEILVSKYLLDALHAASRKELVLAFELLDKARALAPQFFEVHRVAAITNALAGNIQEAEESYIAAIELEPNSAPLHYWYGNFLARSMHDAGRALEQYSYSEKLAPGEPQVLLECARCEMYLARFSKARELIAPLEKERRISTHLMRKVFDLGVQIHLREAEYWYRQKDATRAVGHVGELVAYAESMHRSMFDPHTASTIRHAYSALERCVPYIADVLVLRKIDEWKDRLARLLTQLGVPAFEAMLDRWNYGVIKRVIDGRFGFIGGDDSVDYYFHTGALRTTTADIDKLIGIRVRFELGMNAQGACATNISEATNPELRDSQFGFEPRD